MEDPIGLLGCLGDLEQIAARLIDNLASGGDEGPEIDLALKLFGTMTGAYLSQLATDRDHPAFLPSVGYYQRYGSPNPDTVYRTAMIDGSGEYVITGNRGTVPDVTIMPFGAPTAQGLRTYPAYDFADLDVGSDGTFEVILSREPRHGATNWWALDPGVQTLMLRSTSSEWGAHIDPRLAIIRFDRDPRRERPGGEFMRTRLRAYGDVVEAMIMSGARRVGELRARGVINRLESVDYSASGGLKDQQYFEGMFSLADGEVLLVEVPTPAEWGGFSFSLTDPVFSTLDWGNAHSSLNHRQASIDSDGRLRVVVGPSDPSVKNWLDTTGHTSGVLQFRWFGAAEDLQHRLSVVSPDAVESLVPATTERVSSDERAAIVRARQIGVQLRSLW